MTAVKLHQFHTASPKCNEKKFNNNSLEKHCDYNSAIKRKSTLEIKSILCFLFILFKLRKVHEVAEISTVQSPFV